MIDQLRKEIQDRLDQLLAKPTNFAGRSLRWLAVAGPHQRTLPRVPRALGRQAGAVRAPRAGGRP